MKGPVTVHTANPEWHTLFLHLASTLYTPRTGRLQPTQVSTGATYGSRLWYTGKAVHSMQRHTETWRRTSRTSFLSATPLRRAAGLRAAAYYPSPGITPLQASPLSRRRWGVWGASSSRRGIGQWV